MATQAVTTLAGSGAFAFADGFGAGDYITGVLNRSEVAGRGTGSAVRTPLEEFEARPRDELRCVWTAVMFLTRLPCPGWCDHHPGYLPSQRVASNTSSPERSTSTVIGGDGVIDYDTPAASLDDFRVVCRSYEQQPGVTPTVDLPLGFEVTCNAPPSMFAYPKPEEKPSDDKKLVTTAVLSTTARARARDGTRRRRRPRPARPQ